MTNKEAKVLVDDNTYEWASKLRWHHQYGGGYIKATKHGKTIYLHRAIIGAKRGEHVDHVNRNKLDNRLENLRICTQEQNNRNTNPKKRKSSKYKGVYKNNSRVNPYRAQISVNNGESIHLGCFKTEWEAAKAYNEKAKEAFGEFAYLNEKASGDYEW